jgi:hypothetical protein
VEDWMNVFSKCFLSISERWSAARRCYEEYERLLLPVKTEYLEYLDQKVTLQPPSFRQATSDTSSLCEYQMPPSAATEVDEAYQFWTIFNPTTSTVDGADPVGASAYNLPPQDWNAEFSLNVNDTMDMISDAS